MNTREISSIYCSSLVNIEGVAHSYRVGNGDVTAIKARDQILGNYSILWFDVYHGDTVSSSHNATDMVSIHYMTDAQ